MERKTRSISRCDRINILSQPHAPLISCLLDTSLTLHRRRRKEGCSGLTPPSKVGLVSDRLTWGTHFFFFQKWLSWEVVGNTVAEVSNQTVPDEKSTSQQFNVTLDPLRLTSAQDTFCWHFDSSGWRMQARKRLFTYSSAAGVSIYISLYATPASSPVRLCFLY